MNEKLIIGNFKMNLLKNDIIDYINEVKKYNFHNVVYCPSNIYLQEFINNNLAVGSQDVSPYESGSHTGDVSANQLKSIGVKYTIVGHSERRKDYKEKDVIVNKINNLQKEDIIPIFCIGETKEDYENDETLNILRNEIDFIFDKVNPNNIIIAYEPIWAIGTGLFPSKEEIYNTVMFIKKYIYDKYNVNIKVLYGGSINNENIIDLETISNIDGYLIGGLSIKVFDFIDLIKFINKY